MKMNINRSYKDIIKKDKLTIAMMLLARAITQKFSTPTNSRLCTSSNKRNQAVIQDGRVDIQTKNADYGGNGNKNAWKQNMNQAFNAGNGNDNSNQIVQHKPRVCDAKYFREQMLLAIKDEAGSNLINKENDFMLDTSYGEETMEELTTAVMLMAQIQPANGNVKTLPSYDAKAISEVNASSKVHEQVSHEKRKTIIQTSNDDQIDYNIISDDPYVEDNGGTSDHDSNAHKEYHKIQMLAYNLAKEAFKEREDRYLDDIVDLEEKLDIEGDDLLLHDAEMEVMNMILLSIPNEIYNSVDACTLAKDMWKRVE
ncbi:hypothetical protein Tco_0645827 [Tanacetum coccineum]